MVRIAARSIRKKYTAYISIIVLMLTPSVCFAQASVRTLAGVNAQTGTSYTITAVDQTKLLTFNNVNPVAVTLPSPANTNFGIGAIFSVRNLGTGRVTITPTSSTIDNAATLILDQNQGADIYSDGTNYETQRGSGLGLFGSANPTGTCVNGSNYTNTTTGILWICQAGTWVISSGGGGGGSPSVGANGAVQLANGSGLFTSSGNVFDLNNILAVSEDMQGKGPNPSVDIRAYGARPCDIRNAPCNTGDTATISLGTPTQATISTISDFVKGDGFIIYGAGPTSMSTAPTGLTVAQSISYAGMETGFITGSALGASTRCYKVAARNFNGAQSPPSAETCISNALAAEGPTVNTISSISRSGQTVTIVTTAAHPFLVGCTGALNCGEVFVNSGVSDGTMRGWYAVLSAPNSTTITYQTQDSTAFGSASSATGGQITSYPCVHLTWGSVANAWEYDIYEGASGAETLIDVSQPQGTNTNLTYDDYGSTMLSGVTNQLPLYISNTPPASAVPENLFGTITNIAGSVITMSVTASTAVTSATIRLDAGRAMLAAATAISGVGANNHAGSLYIPSLNNGTFFQYEVNAPLDLHALQFSIDQAGPLYLNEPIQLGTAGSAGFSWYGNRHPQWGGSFTSSAGSNHSNVTIERAQPGVYINSGNGVHFEGLTFQGNTTCTNGIRGVLMESGFRSFWRNDTFSGCTTSTDAVSIPLTFRGINSLTVTDFILDEVSFAPGQGGGGADGGTHTPTFWCHFCGNSTWGELYFINRGVQYDLGNNGQANINVTGPIHINGGQMPLFTTTSVIGNGPSGFQISLGSGQAQTVLMDTIAHPCVAGLGLFPPSVTGPCFPSGAPDVSGQALFRMQGDFNTKSPNTDYWTGGTVDGGAQDSTRIYNYRVGTGESFFTTQVAPPAPTCTVNTGGTLAVGAYTFIIEPAWQDGLQGNQSAASSTCTTSTGNQSITINWTITSGFPLGTNLYYSFNGGGYGSSNTWPALPLPTSQTSLVWTTPPGFNPNHLGFNNRSGPTLANAAEVATPKIDLAGDVTLSAGTGTAYGLNLPGNQPTTGNTFLSCTAANPAVCSWVAGATGVPWSQIGNPVGNLTLSMGTDTSTFNFTSGLLNAFQWYNNTAATVTASQSSPQLALCGTAWTGSSNQDCWTLQHIPGNGLNAAITDSYGHTGSSTGVVTSTFPGPVAAGPGGGAAGAVILPQGTTNSTSTGAVTVQGAASITPYAFSLPGTAPTTGNTFLSCSTAAPSICSWTNANATPNLNYWYLAQNLQAGGPGCGSISNCTAIYGDTRTVNDATSTSTTTVTCPNNDCNFTSADVGKVVWATTQGSGVATGGITTFVCPQTTIQTVNSAQSITLVSTCTASGTANVALWWGHNDGPTLHTLDATLGCVTIRPFDGSVIMIDQGIFNGNNCLGAANSTNPNVERNWWCPTSRCAIVLEPNFNYATCTGVGGTYAGNNVCLFAGVSQIWNLAILGTGLTPASNTNCANASGKTILALTPTGGGIFEFDIFGICPGETGAGVVMNSTDEKWDEGGAQFIMQYACVVAGANITTYNLDCRNDNITTPTTALGLRVTSSAIHNDFSTNPWVGVQIDAGSTMASHGSTFFNPNAAGGAYDVVNNGVWNSDGDFLTCTAAGQSCLNIATGGSTQSRNTSFNGGGVNFTVALGNGTTAFTDQGGNTSNGIFAGCAGNATVLCSISGLQILSAGCRGTATASSTLGLYPWGENTTPNCTSTTVNLGQVMTRSGTASGLNVLNVTGGVNASSGVFTVLKNGSATALTCTIGTSVLGCRDISHTFTYAIGDIISFQFTTQAADTLANLSATVALW